MQRDPARLAPHDLDDHRAVMALGGGAQAVDGLGGDVDGGVEAEAVLGAVHVVVDGFWDAHQRRAHVVQLARDAHGAVAADDHDRVQPQLRDALHHPRRHVDDDLVALQSFGVEKGVGSAGSAENGAATRQICRAPS